MNAPNAAEALRAQAAALRAQAATLDALAECLGGNPGSDLLGVAECRALGVGRDALLAGAARGELKLTRGPRQKLQVERAELKRWLASKPYAIPAAKEPVPDLDAWERSVRRAG